MSKNTIIEQLANNEATLDLAFNNLLLVASVINNKELLKWVEHEISGYQENDNLPLYRKNDKSMHFVYSGMSGTYPINNAPMPITYFPEEIRNEVVNLKIFEGVKIIERQLTAKDNEWTAVRDCTEYATDVYNATGIQCFSISQVLQKNHYEKVYNNIKVHLIKILLMIEKYFGSLDTAELEAKKYEKQKILAAAKDISEYVSGLYDDKAGIPNPRISMPAKNQTLEKKEQLPPQKAEINNQNLNQQPIYPQAQQMPPQQMYQMPQQQPMIPQQIYQMPQQQPMTSQPIPQQQIYQMPQQQQVTSQIPVPQPQMPLQQMPEVPQQEPQQLQMPLQEPHVPAFGSSEVSQEFKAELPSPSEDTVEGQFLRSRPEAVIAQDQLKSEEINEQEGQSEQESDADFVARVYGLSDKDVKKQDSDNESSEKKEGALKAVETDKEEAAKAADIRKDRLPKSLLDYLEEKKSELNKKPE